MKNILQYLELYAQQSPDKTAFADENSAITYGELYRRSAAVGSALTALGGENRPVAIYMGRGAAAVAAMWGITYSGNFYVVLDVSAPRDRQRLILDTLQPAGIVTDELHCGAARELGGGREPLLYEELCRTAVDEERLLAVRRRMIDTDPLYALFTSGSTGVPKGAVVSHRSVMSYVDWVSEAFGIDADTVFGSQTPLYFSMSVLDVYSTLRNGGTLHLIPKKFFSFPMSLLSFLQERRINTIYWVPSALCLMANWDALAQGELPFLRKILFAGEVMPVKQLNYWRRHLPDAMYANLYGPTEVTDICAYYILDREFADDEALPIGRACDNCGLLVIGEDGREAPPGGEGELYVRGSFLAHGYYNNPEKTGEAFVQNPLNPHYPEPVYRTGDLVRYNERGELVFLSRRDFQIKRKGYRIELGEIEAAAGSFADVAACAAIYVTQTGQLVLCLQGRGLSEPALWEQVKGRLPSYMYPDRLLLLKKMPYNANGKIDRLRLTELCCAEGGAV